MSIIGEKGEEIKTTRRTNRQLFYLLSMKYEQTRQEGRTEQNKKRKEKGQTRKEKPQAHNH